MIPRTSQRLIFKHSTSDNTKNQQQISFSHLNILKTVSASSTLSTNELASGVLCTVGVGAASTELRFLFRYELAVDVAGDGNSYGGGGGLNPGIGLCG